MTSHACPSCAGPLDDEGVCTICGSLSQSLFGPLNLGAPQIADAVAIGLDFYHLLEVPADADTHTVARRYRRLRALFPDDPHALAHEPARRLALLEVAGRALTDPTLRAVYDDLRGRRTAQLRTSVVSCAGCHAPLPPDAKRCEYCGTSRPSDPRPPSALAAPPPADAVLVDYYAMLGLNPSHLLAMPMVSETAWGIGPIGDIRQRVPSDAPDLDEIDAAAVERQRAILFTPGLAPQRREEQLAEIDVARAILRDQRRRGSYDALWKIFQRGAFGAIHLGGFESLRQEALAELGRDAGPPSDGAALLAQGRGMIEAGLPREAEGLLRQALQRGQTSSEADALYLRAALAMGDPLDLTAHTMRLARAALDRLRGSDHEPVNAAALVLLIEGLAARDEGRAEDAQRSLHAAARLDGELAAAWRGLAALALGRGDTEAALSAARRALHIDGRDERALLMIVGGCLRARRRDEAYLAAGQLAHVRGDGWDAARVLAEIGG